MTDPTPQDRPVEVPDADLQEQLQDAVTSDGTLDEDASELDGPLEADPADAQEQRQTLGDALDDDYDRD